MSGAKWQNIAGSKNFFSHNFKEQKNGLVNLSFMPFLAISYTDRNQRKYFATH